MSERREREEGGPGGVWVQDVESRERESGEVLEREGMGDGDCVETEKQASEAAKRSTVIWSWSLDFFLSFFREYLPTYLALVIMHCINYSASIDLPELI